MFLAALEHKDLRGVDRLSSDQMPKETQHRIARRRLRLPRLAPYASTIHKEYQISSIPPWSSERICLGRGHFEVTQAMSLLAKIRHAAFVAIPAFRASQGMKANAAGKIIHSTRFDGSSEEERA